MVTANWGLRAVVKCYSVNSILPNDTDMTLNITDPAILFPGISLLFLAYTNRYLALANIIRKLNEVIANADSYEENREKQIKNLLARVALIRQMQLFGILAFLCCTVSMSALLLGFEWVGLIAFGGSMLCMFISLCLAFLEVARSGDGLRLEIERTHTTKTMSRY